MSGYADYSHVSHLPIRKCPVVKATARSLSGIGHLIDSFEDEKCVLIPWPRHRRERPLMRGTGIPTVTHGKFTVWWDGNLAKGRNQAVNSGEYTVALLKDGKLLTREFNYHPDGSQIFYPLEYKPFRMFLGYGRFDKSGIDMPVVKCFEFDGRQGVHIYPNIWHQPPVTYEGSLTFDNKQASTHACVGYDSIREEGIVLGFNIKS